MNLWVVSLGVSALCCLPAQPRKCPPSPYWSDWRNSLFENNSEVVSKRVELLQRRPAIVTYPWHCLLAFISTYDHPPIQPVAGVSAWRRFAWFELLHQSAADVALAIVSPKMVPHKSMTSPLLLNSLHTQPYPASRALTLTVATDQVLSVDALWRGSPRLRWLLARHRSTFGCECFVEELDFAGRGRLDLVVVITRDLRHWSRRWPVTHRQYLFDVCSLSVSARVCMLKMQFWGLSERELWGLSERALWGLSERATRRAVQTT